MPLHFDVLLDPEDKIDGSTDHLRYRYVDFLTLPGAAYVSAADAAAWLRRVALRLNWPRLRLLWIGARGSAGASPFTLLPDAMLRHIASMLVPDEA